MIAESEPPAEPRPLVLPESVRRLLLELRAIWESERAFLVGGYLRDLLLGRETRDLDLALSGDVLELGRRAAVALGGTFVALHEEHAVARIVLPVRDSPVRYVDVARLRGDIESDLAARDFTVNAMALPLDSLDSPSRAIIDPFHGRDDLSKKTIRAIGDAVFRNDSLRLMRGPRLCVELGFDLDPATAETIRRDAPLLAKAAPERRRDELARIFETQRAATGLRLLDGLGLLDVVLPEVTAARGVPQPKEHYWDVFQHLLETVVSLDVMLAEQQPADARVAVFWRELWVQLSLFPELRAHFSEETAEGRTRGGLLKLAGLLHDVAKPETKRVEESGRVRFFGHPQLGAQKAEAILKGLRYSGAETRLVAVAVEEHMRPMQLGAGGPPTRRALYRFFRDTGEAAFDVLFLSLADHMAARGPRLTPLTWHRHVAYIAYLLQRRRDELLVEPVPRLLTGHDLIAELGLTPGGLIGRLLKQIEEARAVGEISTREEALALAARLLKKPANDSAGP